VEYQIFHPLHGPYSPRHTALIDPRARKRGPSWQHTHHARRSGFRDRFGKSRDRPGIREALFGRPLTSIWHVSDGLSLLQTKACAKAHAGGERWLSNSPARGFAGALRRSELMVLQAADLVEAPGGCRVLVRRRSKTNQEGQGQEVAIPHGSRIRPVKLLRQWLETAGISDGPIFRQVNKGGRAGDALDPHSVGMILKRRCRLAELDRPSSAATPSAAASSPVVRCLAVASSSCWKSADTSRWAYMKRADLFDDHAGAAFL
jgi:hypothetical protein